MKMQLQFYTTSTELNTTNSALTDSGSNMQIKYLVTIWPDNSQAQETKKTKMSRACGHGF